MTPEEIQQRDINRESYITWVENACRRCESNQVDRPPTITISVAQQIREREEQWR